MSRCGNCPSRGQDRGRSSWRCAPPASAAPICTSTTTSIRTEPPVVLGHELAGEVVAAGDGVTRVSWAIA